MKIKAHIIHCVPKESGFKYPENVGSILALIPKYATKIWLKKKHIKNYNALNMFIPYALQKIELIDDNDYIEYFVNNSINNKMIDLCKYKK